MLKSMESLDSSITLLRSRKKRITKTRKQILAILYTYGKPISAPELLDKLKLFDLAVNKTTVYRELAFLLKQELVKEVRINPYIVHFEPAYLSHHHHLVCSNCGSIDEVLCGELESPIKLLEDRILKDGFAITRHNLEFYGLCADCM